MPDVVYDVDRVGVPNWVLDQHFSSLGDDDFGGQVAWHFATPWAFRALASPRTGERLLRAPNQDDPHEHRLAYWTSLLYLLTYRLGWARLDRGLKWWFDGGADSDDPTVQLIAKTWGRDGALGQLAQWVHKDNYRVFADTFAELCGYVEQPGAQRSSPDWPAGGIRMARRPGATAPGGRLSPCRRIRRSADELLPAHLGRKAGSRGACLSVDDGLVPRARRAWRHSARHRGPVMARRRGGPSRRAAGHLSPIPRDRYLVRWPALRSRRRHLIARETATPYSVR